MAFIRYSIISGVGTRSERLWKARIYSATGGLRVCQSVADW